MAIEADPASSPARGEVALVWQPLEEQTDTHVAFEVGTYLYETTINPYSTSKSNVHTNVNFAGTTIAVNDTEISGSVAKIQEQLDNRSALAPDTKAKVALKDYLSTLHIEDTKSSEQEVRRLQKLFNRIGSVAAAGAATVGIVTGYEIGTGHVGNEFSITIIGALIAACAFIVGNDRFPIRTRLAYSNGVAHGEKTGRAKFALAILEQNMADDKDQTA